MPIIDINKRVTTKLEHIDNKFHPNITLNARLAILHSLQEIIKIKYHYKISKTNDISQLIYKIFTYNKLTGSKLLKFKQMVDYQAKCYINCYDMTYIIFNLINVKYRDLLLKYFQQNKTNKKYIHIMTDVDDTLFANPKFPAGSDYSHTPKELYPNVVHLFKSLNETDYVTLLTARPFFLEKKMRSDDNKIKQAFGEINILTGSRSYKELFNVLKSYKDYLKGSPFTNPTYIAMGEKKYSDFKKYINIYPEYKIIFFGDTGQGDLYAATKMTKKSKNVVCLIHHIVDKNGKYTYENDNDYQRIYPMKGMKFYKLKLFKDNKNLYMFDNYTDLKNSVNYFKSLM